MLIRLAFCLILIPLLFNIGYCETPNMLANPGFELGQDDKGIPREWRLWERVNGKATVRIDKSVRRSGESSVRISASEDVTAVLLSPNAPVQQGEEFSIGAWVKAEGVGASTTAGNVVVTAAFVRTDGKFVGFTRLGKMITSGDWQLISGTASVPAGVATITFEIGLKNAKGTVWFDDVWVRAGKPYSVRPTRDTGELLPGKQDWSLSIANRQGDKRDATVKVTCAGKASSLGLHLDGSAVQTVTLPIITGKPGPSDVHVQLLDKNTRDVLAQSPLRLRVLDVLELEPLVPTHFCIEDGTPALEARVWCHLRPDEVKSISVSLTDSKGRVLDSRPPASIRTGWTDVELSSSKAGLGDYKVEAKLIAKNGNEYAQSQPWHVIRRAQARVTFNEAGYPVVDGHPIFPLGTFNSGRYDQMVQAGFNVTHAWNRLKLADEGARTDQQKAKDFFDDTEKAGMKAIGFLHVSYMEREDWDGLLRRIRMFRNHPALLAWDQEEGVARGEVDTARGEKLAKMVRKEDPNHPFVLADSYGVITDIDRKRFFREDLMDGGMWWYYPIPMGQGAEVSALEGQDAGDGLTMNPPSFLTTTGKPLWVGLQAYKKPGQSDARFPTEREYRCMAYLSVVHGAKGLLYYMGGSASKLAGSTDEKRPWGYLHDLVPELKEMSPVFMSPTSREHVSVQSDGLVDTLLKETGGTCTLIAVNRSNTDVQASIGIQSLASRNVEVLFEDRKVQAQSGKLADRFAAYGVHVYRWKI